MFSPTVLKVVINVTGSRQVARGFSFLEVCYLSNVTAHSYKLQGGKLRKYSEWVLFGLEVVPPKAIQ